MAKKKITTAKLKYEQMRRQGKNNDLLKADNVKGQAGPAPKVTTPQGEQKSNRQQIREAVDADPSGAAALKLGVKLGMKAGTVASYVKDWLKIRGTPSAAPKVAPKTKAQAPRKPVERPRFAPDYRYPSRAAAHRAACARARTNGLAETAFHVLEKDGKFAFVPAHIEPDHIPQFEEGDWVRDTFMSNSLGRIVKAGPEQSEVKYEKPRTGFAGDTEFVPNVYMCKVDAPEGKPAKAKPVKKKGKSDA